MNIYEIILEQITEGMRAHNKNRAKSRYNQGLKHLAKYDKKTKNADKDSYGTGEHLFGREVRHKPKDNVNDRLRSLNKADKNIRASKKLESIESQIYDILVEGLIKAANKAKKNAFISDRGNKAIDMHGVKLARDFSHKTSKKGIGRAFNQADQDPNEVYDRIKKRKLP